MSGIEYERIEKIVLLFWDDEENFNLDKTQQKIGKLFQKIHHVKDVVSFKNALGEYSDMNQEFLCFVHLSHSRNNKGLDDFINSKVLKEYPNLRYYLITSALKSHVYGQHNEQIDVYTYDGYQEKIFTTFIPQTKWQIIDIESSVQMVFPQIKYGVITALYKDEFEELQRVFDFPPDRQIKTETKVFHRGYLKSNPDIEIVAAVPNSTGMVDSSIIATQMLEFFRPKYLLMSGVCGGASDYNFGDIIVAKQIFTFQKGKVSSIKIPNKEGELEQIDLFDVNGKLVDYEHLFDEKGNQITISVEKFEIEHDAIIPLDSLLEDTLHPKLTSIEQKINATIALESFISGGKQIRIVIEPMACSTMVINKDGYFEDTIRSIHRKTAAVEMESYAVARACQFANNGKTVPIIFKSVMDNAANKKDGEGGINFKKFAAYTSAQFMRYLFEENVI